MNIVEEYNPQTDTWISKTSMPTARHALGLVTASDGNIYAIGGFDGVGNYINTVEVYDPQTDTWMTGNSMPTARGNMGVVATNDGKIYVIGGITSTQFINIVEEYDIHTNSWTSRASMPSYRAGFGMAIIDNGMIYAIGGITYEYDYVTLNLVEEYNPQTDTWKSRENMPTSRGGLGLALYNGFMIYAIGGRSLYWGKCLTL